MKNVNEYYGNGETTQFFYTFRIQHPDDIEVLVDGVLKTMQQDYAVGGVGIEQGGTVTLKPAPDKGSIITIKEK